MAATKQSMEDDSKAFGDAFADTPEASVEQSEDEAFGLTMPEADAMATEGDAEADVAVVAQEETPVADAGEAPMPEMTQAERSWEGRLRAREAEIKAKAAALEEKQAATSPAGDPDIETPAENATESAGDESDEAIRQLSDDFGPEFVGMIVKIAAKAAKIMAGEQVAEVGQTVREMIDDINSSRAKRHFEDVFDAHPDFVEVSESVPFGAYVEALPDAEKAEAKRIIASGSAKEINRLLSAFKASVKETATAAPMDATEDDTDIDSAEGVRSTGMRLPTQPAAGKDDFSAAWDEKE